MPPAIYRILVLLLVLVGGLSPLMADEVSPDAGAEVVEFTLDQKIDVAFARTTGWFVNAIFSTVPVAGYDVLWVVLWLAFAGIALTLAFKFINIRAFPLAMRTVRGKYSDEKDPGEITHFQALTAAVSGTVGLGNIAGVAIGIAIAGPGVAFWLFIAGFIGMATKFAECTLGVKYREFDSDGCIHGGPMYYLKKGFAERGLAPLGTALAIIFAICCIFASFGGGNIFQVNQVTAQLINVTGGEASPFAERQWLFGLILAVITAAVILGGIRSIAKVTCKLVPAMCFIYIVSALIVLAVNFTAIPQAIGIIVTEAFNPRPAITGGILAAIIWGMRRATFSNEAGIGSAPIAHAAAKTRMPASEGVVALLEPFIDTVVVCTVTSLVIVTAMNFNGDSAEYVINNQTFTLGGGGGTAFGIGLTSLAFQTVHEGFKYILFMCVLLFAFSTLITWSYYGLQSWQYLFGRGRGIAVVYKVIFCFVIIAGASASMDNAVDFSDASLFAMSIPNLIGVYFLLPVVRKELSKFQRYARHVDDGATLEDARARAESESGG
jgi:AGCS family alanine or glycine:cation symporter